jgi:hypothetical protein
MNADVARVLVVYSDGSSQATSITATPDNLRSLVRGHAVRVVVVDRGCHFWHGTDNRAYNPLATALAWSLGWASEPLRGVVVFVGGTDQVTDLPLDVLTTFASLRDMGNWDGV